MRPRWYLLVLVVTATCARHAELPTAPRANPPFGSGEAVGIFTHVLSYARSGPWQVGCIQRILSDLNRMHRGATGLTDAEAEKGQLNTLAARAFRGW